jgi:MFS family permease
MTEAIQLPLKLSFRLTRADIAAYERLPREFSRASVLGFFGVFFLIGIALGAFEDELNGYVPQWLADYQYFVLLLAAAVIAYAFITLVLTLRTNWRIARVALPAGETDVNVSQSGLRVTDGSLSRDFGWALVAKVIETADHVFLCLAPRTALILPLRAFASHDDKTAFADLSESLSRDAEA